MARSVFIRLIKGFFLVIVIFFFVFLLLEVLFRITKAVPVSIVNETIFPHTLGDYKPSQELISDYILPHYVKINSLGLRGEEIAVKKPNNVFRILVLGDSFTFGSRVDNNETYSYLLEEDLNSHFDEKPKIEVINAGHSAYSTREEYEYFMERGIHLDPDMVIISWFPNDIRELSKPRSHRDLLKKHYEFEPFKSYVRKIASLNMLRVYISARLIESGKSSYVARGNIDIYNSENGKEQNLWNKCFSYLTKFKNTCDENNIDLLLVSLADLKQFAMNYGLAPQQKLREFALSKNINFCDTSLKFELYASEGNINSLYLAPKDIHFSPAGHMIVANSIHDGLIFGRNIAQGPAGEDRNYPQKEK